MKKCTKCNIIKEDSCFNKRNNVSNILRSWCKECCKKEYKNNREKILNQKKEYYDNNKYKFVERNKKYREKNKEIISEKNKIYQENNKERISKQRKQYREENKEIIAKQKKNFYNKNIDTIKNQKIKYYIDNKEKINEYHKKYYANNKEKIKKYCEINKEKIMKRQNALQRSKYNNDPCFKIIHRIRQRIRVTIKNNSKATSSLELLGCTAERARIHLESKFQEGMTWENYGVHGWHIDHIIPCAAFDLSKEEEQRKCFHYTNLQPLWAKDNLSKGSKII